MRNLKIAAKTLTNEHDLELYKKANAGDKDAIERLLCDDINMIVSTAKQYYKPGVTMQELIIAGIKEAKRYYSKSTDSNYVAWCVRQSILMVLDKKGLLPKRFTKDKSTE